MEIPVCAICEKPKAKLTRTTKIKFESIWVCDKGKPNSRMPCDGHVFAIALKND